MGRLSFPPKIKTMEQKVTSINPGDQFKCIKDTMGFFKDEIYVANVVGNLTNFTQDRRIVINEIDFINQHFIKLPPEKSIHERLKELQEEAKKQGLKIDAVIEKDVKVGMVGKFYRDPHSPSLITMGVLHTITMLGSFMDKTGYTHKHFTPLSEKEAIDELKKLYKNK